MRRFMILPTGTRRWNLCRLECRSEFMTLLWAVLPCFFVEFTTRMALIREKRQATTKKEM